MTHLKDAVERRVGVVIACRRSDDRWLMVRRGAEVERAPLKVGFPGGEIESGESQRAAVVREAREELGVEVRPVECVWQIDLPDRPWRLFGWFAELLSERIAPCATEVEEVLWLTAEEGAAHPDALPTNRAFFEALRRFTMR